jgi:hypothetical protein
LKIYFMAVYMSLFVSTLTAQLTAYFMDARWDRRELTFLWYWLSVTPRAFLMVGFITPFFLPFIFNGEVEEIQPWLVGFQGMMPIDQLESLVFGNYAGRLNYSASSGLLCSRDTLTRKGVAPTIDMDAIPTGHQIFTLLDTVSYLPLYPVSSLAKLHSGKPNGDHLLRGPAPNCSPNLRERRGYAARSTLLV